MRALALAARRVRKRMMMISLLYVSRSALPPREQQRALDEIVATALRNNPRADVTGGLVFTGRHFAQNLEGPEGEVTALMERIGRDPRHRDVDIVYRESIPERQFPVWAMAYAGPSTFVAAHVLALADPAPPAVRQKAAKRLIGLMRQFAEAHRIARERESGRPL